MRGEKIYNSYTNIYFSPISLFLAEQGVKQSDREEPLAITVRVFPSRILKQRGQEERLPT